MTIEEVAERADAWSEAIKKILKAISAAGVALAAAISALLMWWPNGGEEPDNTDLDHIKIIEKSDVIVLVAPIWNFRMPAMVEGWIDKVLSPPWAFSFKKLFGNYGFNNTKTIWTILSKYKNNNYSYWNLACSWIYNAFYFRILESSFNWKLRYYR